MSATAPLLGVVLGLAALLATPPPSVLAQEIAARPVVQSRRTAPSATVRYLAARRIRGRTEVRIAGAGLRSYRLSEPFRTEDRWQLYLDVSDARLALFVPRTPLVAGSVSRISAEQRGGGVRVVVESRAYGGYGFQVVNDTLVVWLTDARSAGGRAAQPQATTPARSGRTR